MKQKRYMFDIYIHLLIILVKFTIHSFRLFFSSISDSVFFRLSFEQIYADAELC